MGLRLFEVPSVLSGKHTTVIYEAVEAANDATQILSDADDVVPRLTGLFGTDRAAAHPVIFVVSSRKQGQQLSGVKIFRKELPEGFVINGVAYIEWPVWGPGNVLERDGTIAHELTHVASWGCWAARRTACSRGWRCTRRTATCARWACTCRSGASRTCTRTAASRRSRSGARASPTGACATRPRSTSATRTGRRCRR